MKRSVLFAVLSAVGISGTAFAQMGPHGSELEGLGHERLMQYMKVAQLTDDQKAQAKQVMLAAHEQTKPLMAQIRSLRRQLSDRIVATGSLQLSDLLPIRQQIRELQIQVDDIALGSVIKIRNTLRPDQIQHIADAHAKMKNLMGQMEELGGGPDEGEAPAEK